MTLAGSVGSYAHDFTATIDGQRLYFNITNQASKTAEVTYKGSIADKLPNEISGTIEIPAKVKHDNVVYSITAIGAKAFSNATKLNGIVMPSTINKIGDFAFACAYSINELIIPDSVEEIGKSFLEEVLPDKIIVPANLVEIVKDRTESYYHNHIIVSE